MKFELHCTIPCLIHPVNSVMKRDTDSHTDYTISEEIAHPAVYHHLSQVSVDIQLNELIKCREDSGVQM